MTTKRTRARPSTGVIATIHVDDGEVTLVFHDAARAGAREGWEEVRLFTEKPYSRASFVDRALRREDYEDIGFNVVNRLCALAGLEPSPEPAPAPSARKRRVRKGR